MVMSLEYIIMMMIIVTIIFNNKKGILQDFHHTKLNVQELAGAHLSVCMCLRNRQYFYLSISAEITSIGE